jgi:hypothetical protein
LSPDQKREDLKHRHDNLVIGEEEYIKNVVGHQKNKNVKRLKTCWGKKI